MNIPKAIELSLAAVFREHAEKFPHDARLRPYQTPTDDPGWNVETDRYFPLLEIRAAPPQVEESGNQLEVNSIISAQTMAVDDPDKRVLSDLYEIIEDIVIGHLIPQFRDYTNTGGPHLQTFDQTMGHLVNVADHFQGRSLVLGENLTPYNDNGINVIGLGIVFKYGRADF